MSTSTLVFKGFMIPVALADEPLLATTLWGQGHVPDPEAWAILATDGSQLANGSVGAAIVFMDDGIAAHEQTRQLCCGNGRHKQSPAQHTSHSEC
jgi:hypothetical protein